MKILAIQNRMGIGDTVIFLPYIRELSKKFKVPIDLLVRENSKADQFLEKTNYIGQIHILERNNSSDGKHDGFFGSLRLSNYLKSKKFDIIFIFNSSLRFFLIAKFAGINKIYQYPLLRKKNQHITKTAELFIKDSIHVNKFDDPHIEVDKNKLDLAISKYNIKKNQKNILLGIGGSGPTKRIPAKIFIQFMERMNENENCKFFLATGKNEDEQKILHEILNSKLGYLCTPLDDLIIKDTLPIIQNCNAAVCNDTSFSHLSAAIGVNTITLMADTPLIYGSYSSKMHPIIPDGEKNVTHNTLGKDRINPEKIFKKLIEILN